MSAAMKDLRHAVRTLRRSPGFACVAIATLALGIGANTAIFSVVESVLLRPLPFQAADRLVLVYENDRIRGTRVELASLPDFLDFQEQSTVFEDLAALSGRTPTLTGAGDPERLEAAAVTANYFRVLGVEPALGRSFAPDEERPGNHRAAVLSHGLWQERFGGDPLAVGRSITLDGEPFTVVGVAPAEAVLPGAAVALWTPLAATELEMIRGRHNALVVGRLAPGVSLTRSQAEMDTIMGRLEREYPDDNLGRGALVLPLHEAIVEDSRPGLVLLAVAIGLVLLIGCANVSGLMLARTASRRKEFAIRCALGAGSARVFRQVLSESLVIALLGGASGVLVAVWIVDLLAAFAPADIPRLDRASINASVLAFNLVISMLSGVVLGLAPALRFSRIDLGTSLKQAGLAGRGPGRSRVRRALVAAEIALTLMLVIGAGLLGRSLWNLIRVEPGYDPRGLLALTLELPDARYPRPEGWPVVDWPRMIAFQDALLDRVRATPGVRSAGLAINNPLQAGWTTRFAIEGRPEPAPGQADEAFYRPVSPGYFETQGVPLIRGRLFTDRDDARAPNVAIINEAFARRHLPGEDPLGRGLNISGHWFEIVGVVGDVRFRGVAEGTGPAMYPALRQTPFGRFSLMVRTAGEPSACVAALREVVRALDRDLAVASVLSVEKALRGSIGRQRFTALLMAAFAGMAMVLAALGIYGVVSFFVTDRAHEIGVRMALGAGRSGVVRLIARQAMSLVASGLAVGLAGSLVLSRILSALLFGVMAADPATLLAACLALTAVSLIACSVPALRATRVDPLIALRCE